MNGSISELNSLYVHVFIPNITWTILCFFLGFFGNGCVLILYIYGMKHNREDRYFIPILAFWDMLAILFATIYHTSEYFFLVTFPSSLLCTLVSFLSFFTSAMSAITLFWVGFQRLLKIRTPHGLKFTLFWRRIAISVTTLIMFCFFVPVITVAKTRSLDIKFKGQNVTINMCTIGEDSSKGLEGIYYKAVFILTILNIVAIVCVYVPVAWVIYKTFFRKRNTIDRNVWNRDSEQNTNLNTPPSTDDTNVDSNAKDKSDIVTDSDRKRNTIDRNVSNPDSEQNTNLNTPPSTNVTNVESNGTDKSDIVTDSDRNRDTIDMNVLNPDSEQNTNLNTPPSTDVTNVDSNGTDKSDIVTDSDRNRNTIDMNVLNPDSEQNTNLNTPPSTDVTNVDSNATDKSDIVTDSKFAHQRTKSTQESKKTKALINYNCMFCTVVIFYLVSYLPTVVMLALSLGYNASTKSELAFFECLRRFYILNHVVNPYIYGLFDIYFRKSIFAFLLCKYERKNVFPYRT